MAKSTAKVILFSRVTVDKKVHQWPTAVFNDHAHAKTYATTLSVAYKSGDVDGVKSMDKNMPLDSDGKLIPGLRFSIAEVPYDPSPALSANDMFDDDETPAT
jgi:hypothetical protein